MFIYEIGAITCHYRNQEFEKATTWRNQIDKWAKDNCIKTFNPNLTYQIEVNHSYDPKMCLAQNDYYIRKCDIAVVNMHDIESSPGSIYELTRFKEMRKPVIGFGEKHWSPHLNSCISHQCDSLDEVLELISNMFSQGNF